MNAPYYAVIFTSTLKENKGYEEEAEKMLALAKNQNGFLGFEGARQEIGISVSYWETLDDIKNWKNQSEHLLAQEKGKSDWYASYHVRITKVEREYTM